MILFSVLVSSMVTTGDFTCPGPDVPGGPGSPGGPGAPTRQIDVY